MTLSRAPLFAGLCAGTLFLSGCSGGGLLDSGPTAQVFDRQGIDVISEPSDRRATFFKDAGSTERFCRAPGPDFAVTASEGISLGLSLPVGGGKSVGQDEGKGALSLGGRNPEVLLAREMLFRACELSLNINADGKTSREIYERFLQSIEKISATQTGAGTAASAAGAPTVSAPSVSVPSTSNSSSGSSDGGSSGGSSSSGDSGF